MDEDEINILLNLIGREFKYKSDSSDNLSEWTDVVKSIFFTHNMIKIGNNPIGGYEIKLIIRGEKNRHVYEFNKCVFVTKKSLKS